MTDVSRTGPAVVLPSPYAVTEAATRAALSCATAAAALGEARRLPVPEVSVDTRAVATAVSEERYLLIDGEAPAFWAPLSGFFPARDGWVRLHGNYPHHAAAARRALGCAEGAGRDEVAAATRDRDAAAVESAVVAAGGVGAAVRTEREWLQTPQGGAAAAAPLVEQVPTGVLRPLPPVESNTGPARGLPATGLRVLDLTRVIAGPLAGRTLAAWGAQVLRIDPPHRPELSWQHAEMDAGKLSAVLDVGTADGAAAVRALAADADVVLLGYRPGALARHGLAADDLLADAGHLVVVELSAWGWTGPWSSRRGFDSIVQAASGIAAGCAAQDGTPGALPAQVLDHATGFLAAGAALDAVRRRPESGGTRIRLALATTAEWLRRLSSGGTADAPAELDPAPFLRQDGGHRWVAPPFAVGGVALEFPFPARPYGADQPVWPSQDGASTGIRGSGEATRPNRSVPAAQSR